MSVPAPMPPDAAVLAPLSLQNQLAVTPAQPTQPAATVAPDVTTPDLTQLDRRAASYQALRDIDGIISALLALQDIAGVWGTPAMVLALVTANDHPIDFTSSAVRGFIGALVGPFLDVPNLLLAGFLWTGAVTGCLIYDAEMALSSATWTTANAFMPALPSEACQPLVELDEALDKLRRVGDLLGDVMDQALAHPLAFFLDVLGVVNVVLAILAEELRADPRFERWLFGAAQDPNRAGQVVGLLAGTIVPSLLPGGSEITAAADAARLLEMSAAAAEAEELLANASKETAEAVEVATQALEAEPLLAKLVLDMREALQEWRAGARLIPRIDNDRFRVFRNIAEVATGLGADLPRLQEAVVKAYLALYGRVGRFLDLEAVCTRYNAQSLLVYMLDLDERGVESLDAVEAVRQTRMLKAQVFERAHIVDKRFFVDQFSEAWKAFGWESEKDMDAVIVQARDHTGSLPRYFKRLGQGLPSDPRELDNITKTFMDAIVFEKSGSSTKAAELVVRSDTKASQLLRAHLNVWNNKFPRLAKLGLADHLAARIAQLEALGL